jgi:tripartite-type tricarboxylate transporter receptor subunit TctC
MASIASYLLVLCNSAAVAQDQFPSHAITVVVPLPPGGSADPVMRLIAKNVSDSTHQSVVVDNRPGGGGNIATKLVKHAEPNGYTLIMGNTSTHAVNVSLYSNPGFDPVKDFQPITVLVSMPTMLVVPAASPATTMRELAALAKTKPGGLNYGSQGVGSGGHLLGEMMQGLVGAPMVHVPYRGAAPAVQDLVTGRLDLVFASYLSAGQFVQEGKLRILGVTGSKRSSVIPDVPTMAENGFPGLEYELWYGMLAPAGTPAAAINVLHEQFVKAARSEDFAKLVVAQGAEVVANSPDEFAKLIAKDVARLGMLIRDAKIKVDE